MALAKVFVSKPCLHSLTTEQMPRKIWLVITPELPRAPRSAPLETASHISSKRFEEQAFISVMADCIVRDIFVPVSPSGTGNTFRASTFALFISNILAPVETIFLKSVLLMTFCINLLKCQNASFDPRARNTAEVRA